MRRLLLLAGLLMPVPALATPGDEIQVYTGSVMPVGEARPAPSSDQFAVKLMLISDLTGEHGLFHGM